jgi:DNA-binding response OmpR family regulator
MAKILIVEDEPQMRSGLRDNLEFEGHQVDFAEDGSIGLFKILENNYDLIILDIMLPKMSGFDVCKKAREKNITTPVIMLTAKGEEIDKVLGLELGADDYLTKPFSLRELLARIKAVLRRTEEKGIKSSERRVKLGNLKVDFSTYDAFLDNKPEPMSHKEFEILYEEFPTTRTVDNFILKLRKRVENDPAHPRHILTVHGIGYKLLP